MSGLKIRSGSGLFARKDYFDIPREVLDLVWIADGPLRNYSTTEYFSSPTSKLDLGPFSIELVLEADMLRSDIEPSLISLKEPIEAPLLSPVPSLGYYPSYSSMLSTQRYTYLKWLQNPFRNIEIGYVFVFYYGLERHLLEGKFEKAFDMIIKLRKVHLNPSFQRYSFNALLLSAMRTQKYEYFEKLDKTLDKQSPDFDISIYLAVKKSFKIPLYCDEIIALAGKVKFQNRHYIRNRYTEFLITLQDLVIERYGNSYIDLMIFNNFPCKKTAIAYLANISINRNIRECYYPDLLTCKEFKETIYDLLKCTHEKVKLSLTEQRKSKK